MLGSRPGLMRADLKSLGTLPAVMDALTMSVISGNNSSRQSFKSQVGKGSSSQDLFGDFCMIALTFSSVAGTK